MPANRQKTLIEWPPKDLAEVDAAAAGRHISRSAWIREACKRHLRYEKSKARQ